MEEVAAGRGSLLFSGTAGQVEETFHTAIHYYQVNGALHHANATDPRSPRRSRAWSAGIASLHDFESAARAWPGMQPVSAPELDRAAPTTWRPPISTPFTMSTRCIPTPSMEPARPSRWWPAAISTCPTCKPSAATMGLPVNNPTVILNGTNPGVIAGGEQEEATLDAEWAGAIAKKAAVKFVVSASTGSSDGVALSAQYIVNHNVAPVMTTSFGLCEQAAGSTYAAFWNSLWQQAAAEGITSFVAAGDSGAAGCDSPSETKATGPLGVNALASSPYNVGVGGTQFSDTANPGQYWSASYNPATLGSALTYIPEAVWNQSGTAAGGSELWAGSGGASTFYSRPAWQTGTGVPADTHRHRSRRLSGRLHPRRLCDRTWTADCTPWEEPRPRRPLGPESWL